MKKYDVIVVGSGPAGMACAALLSNNKIKTLILEKRSSLAGKVCGDGLTPFAIESLHSLGIDVTVLKGKKILRKKVFSGNNCVEECYKNIAKPGFAYGVSRDVFDSFLLENTTRHGAEIIFDYEVKTIDKADNGYLINGEYFCKRVVLACGIVDGMRFARFEGAKNVPYGYSARVVGNCEYDDDTYYFFYDDRLPGGYAWLFPVDTNVWNIGVWTNNQKKIKEIYKEYEKKIFGENVEYNRKPKGALIGTSSDPVEIDSDYICVGDCAFKAKYSSGEGISYAIESGINSARSIIENL